MVCSKHVVFSVAALSGIVTLTILRRRSSRLKSIVGLWRVKANGETEEDQDFISNLSDDILVKILELLPTRDSVRTSILSKRWRNVYAFVPRMEFSCLETFPFEPLVHFSNRKSSFAKKLLGAYSIHKTNRIRSLRENFINRVDTFLHKHSISRIVTCRLSCCFIATFPGKLEEWIQSLGILGINRLNLSFMCRANNCATSTVRCELISLVPSLVHLTLVGCHLRQDIPMQPNHLQFFNLDKVTLTSAAIACILSNCLNLQGLLMENCTTLFSTVRICGSYLQLKYLCIKSCPRIKEIELRADNLILFEYFSHKLIEFSFKHIPKLETIVLTLSHGLSDENPTPYSCGELAKALPPVSSISLQVYGEYYEMFTPAGFDMFRNVRRLRLGFSMFKPDQLSVASVLEMCTDLYEFHLQIEKSSLPSVGQQVTSLKFHDQLKVVIFTGFSGTQSEMDAALYILRSAMVLERMIISYCFSQYLGKNVWAKNGQFPLMEESHETVDRLLGGHAISKDAKVIVRPIYVSDMDPFSRDNPWVELDS